MGRALLCIAVVAVLLWGLAFRTGSGPGSDELTAPAATCASREAAESGPVLVGRPAPADGTAGHIPIDPPPRAHVDDVGRVVIPAEATWGSVLEAVGEAAARAREREDLDSQACVHVLLPGACGLVAVGRITLERGAADPTGLDVEIGGHPTRTRVEAVGAAWITEGGCDARVTWRENGVSMAPWHAALAGLAGTAEVDEDAVRIRADPDLPAEAVLPFLAAAREAALPPVRLGEVPSGRKRFVDAAERELTWLSLHMAPTGAWDEAVSEVNCRGRVRRGHTLPADPATAVNAGQTGLCLLAYLGTGYTNRGDHDFAKTVSKGLRHLRNVQEPDGRFPAAPGWSDAVAHGFAALAMTEAYGLTGSPVFKAPAQRALDAVRAVWESSGHEALATALAAMTLGGAQTLNHYAMADGQHAPLAVDADVVQLVLAKGRSWPVGAGDLRAVCGLVTRVALDPSSADEPDLRVAGMRHVEALLDQGLEHDPLHAWLAAVALNEIGGAPRDRLRSELWGGGLARSPRDEGHPCCELGSLDPPERMLLPGGRTTATALGCMSRDRVRVHRRLFVSSGGR
ncbi:MAG: hypothetical protein AB7T63_18235 [Planctomycetota bacterium]